MRKLPLRRFAPQGKPFLWEVQPPGRLNLFKESSGQALLIILLIMAVALTIGLSVISRSITDIKISEQTEEAARAFSAAEAGIEQAIITGAGTGTFSETGATFQTAVAGFGGSPFVFPQELTPNEIQTLYLANYETDGSLTPFYNRSSIDLCWDGDAAVEASLYYSSGGYKIARYAVDANGGSRTPPNNFAPPDSGGCASLAHKKTLNFPSGSITPLFLRLRVLYVDARVGVAAATGATLPSQGNRIESIGQAGTATRKVEVVRFHPAPPEIFDFALYSGGDLTK